MWNRLNVYLKGGSAVHVSTLYILFSPLPPSVNPDHMQQCVARLFFVFVLHSSSVKFYYHTVHIYMFTASVRGHDVSKAYR